MTIDEMIERITALRGQSALGGDTVLYWCELDREYVEVGDVLLEGSDDGAVVSIVGPPGTYLRST